MSDIEGNSSQLEDMCAKRQDKKDKMKRELQEMKKTVKKKEKELELKKQLREKLRKQKKERRRIQKEMELLRKKRARLDIAITEVRIATQYTVKSQMFVQCDEKFILISVSI